MLIIEVKVAPASGRNKWVLDKNGTLKCFLKNPAEKGLANAELCKTLAKKLSIAQDLVEIVLGVTSKRKTIKIHTVLTYEQFLACVGIEQQIKLSF